MNAVAVITSLEETYHQENVRLLQYLKDQPFESSDLQDELSSCWAGWDVALEEVGSSTDEFEALVDHGHDDEARDICYRIDDWFDAHPDQKEDAAEALMQHRPHEAPTWAHMSLNSDRLLPPSTWMVHWSDKAWEVARHGFTRGVSDITQLGLTTYRRNRIRGEGYNFAFKVDSRCARNRGRKYGSSCVVFQSSGVDCYHGGDEEDQCVFWGPGVTTKPVLITEEGDGFDAKWCVHGTDGRILVRFEDVESCFSWIKSHRDQYRRQMDKERPRPRSQERGLTD